MKTEYYIAKRLYYAEDGTKAKKTTRPAVRVALWGMVIGMMVMIVSIFVVIGFKRTIREKVVGFGAHIEVVNFDNNNTYEYQPICITDTLIEELQAIRGVTSVTPFATKPAMLKTDSAFQAVVMKGTQTTNTFFEQNLLNGRMPENDKEIILSQSLADKLSLTLNNKVFCYFIGTNDSKMGTNNTTTLDLSTGVSKPQIRVRRFEIVGIYRTDLQEFDERFIIGDLAEVQTLNHWHSTQVSGLDIRIDNFQQLDDITNKIYFHTANHADEDGNFFYTQNIVQQYPQIFSWLDLLDMNVVVIIILMLCVSGFCIVSGLLILILDSIPLIGIFKALGGDNRFLRRIFLWQATFLVGRGMLIGNLLALTLCTIQYIWHIVPLDPIAYYVNYVPIYFHWGWWLTINLATAAISLLILLAPATLITKISPAEVMRYE